MTSAYLAVDAGNTKTVAAVVAADGGVLGRGRGGRGDIYNATSVEAAAAAVTGAVRDALAEAEVRADELVAAAFRLAGVDWPEDAEWWRQRLAAELPGLTRFSVANDGFASLRLGVLDGVGLAITVGTGPAVAARGHDGREACTGWWVFDNLGGWGLAEDAVRAVCLCWMGLAGPTALTGALLEVFEVPDVYELRHSFTRRHHHRDHDEVLRATRVVLQVAGAGDAVANGIVVNQARAFAGYAEWVAGQVGEAPGPAFPIVVNGSVATSEHGVLRTALLAALAQRFGDSPVRVCGAPPLAGCILDALAEGGVELSAQLHDRVIATRHPAEFLIT